jgi:hypothetical protein
VTNVNQTKLAVNMYIMRKSGYLIMGERMYILTFEYNRRAIELRGVNRYCLGQSIFVPRMFRIGLLKARNPILLVRIEDFGN